MWWRAQQQKVDSSNVNADWDSSTNSVVPAELREAATSQSKPSRQPGLTPPNLTKGTHMVYLESILKVLVIGLLLGAGLPAVFALGLVAYSRGAAATAPMPTAAVAPNPALKFLGLACSCSSAG